MPSRQAGSAGRDPGSRAPLADTALDETFVAVLDASDNVVWNTSERALALLGVHGLIVIETPDAVLVCAKDRAQDVRRIVDQLTKRGRKDLV